MVETGKEKRQYKYSRKKIGKRRRWGDEGGNRNLEERSERKKKRAGKGVTLVEEKRNRNK